MAKFIGSDLHTGNWGEDYFIEKLMEYLDDTYIIYRNRPIFGAQFDVALFAPRVGIIIFEVKAWKPDTIKCVKNGDSIVIKTVNHDTGEVGEAEENPTNQARGYVYKMRNKIRQKTGKTPLVYSMVCFPNLTKSDYDKKGIEPVCEIEETLLKEDLESRAAMITKLNKSVTNHRAAARYLTPFTDNLMFRVRQIFETDLKLEDQTIKNTDLVEYMTPPSKEAYSIAAYIPNDHSALERIKELARQYSLGTKLYVLVPDNTMLKTLQNEILSVITSKGLAVNGLDLEIDFTGDKKTTKMTVGDSFNIFNCAAYVIPDADPAWKHCSLINGEISSIEAEKILREADRHTNFNFDQYLVEHANIEKNVIVRAGAGTGKTHTMISRIAYICYKQNCAMKEMASRIVMITFTDDAANQMEEKIKQHFNNYYLLTGNSDCLAFINMIEGMQISTIHSYAKKIITALGMEFGYGEELSVTSGDYKLRQIISETVDAYIVEKQWKKGADYVRCPIVLEENDNYFPRSFVLAKIIQINELSGEVRVKMFDLKNSRRFYAHAFDKLDYPMDKVDRCGAAKDAPVNTPDGPGQILSRRLEKKDEAFYEYFVMLHNGKIRTYLENELEIEYSAADYQPIKQMMRYEFQNPSWFANRLQVSGNMHMVNNTVYGFKELVGCRTFLMAHQISTIVRAFESRPIRYMLADEVGLGKTIEACSIIKILSTEKKNLRVLYIVPGALAQQWVNELRYKFEISATLNTGIAGYTNHVIVAMEDLDEYNEVLAYPWGLLTYRLMVPP